VRHWPTPGSVWALRHRGITDLPEISSGLRQHVAELLGRDPRGLEEVVSTTADGEPAVIRVASLVEDRPFPTLFWLVDPGLNYRIDRLEAEGLIGEFQARVDADTSLRQSLENDHRAHIALRNAYMAAPVEQRLRQLGFYDVLQQRGIGGIADFGRIRCLHTWYAAHLVAPNTIGLMLQQRFDGGPS